MPRQARAFAAILAVSAALAGCDGGGDEAPGATAPAPTPAEEPAATTADAEQLEFRAEGGATIRATFTPSGRPGRSPLVILVHQFGSDRSDWDDFVPELTERGYATLAYDIRGMGESETPDGYDVTSFPLDLEAAVEAASERDDVDPERIAGIGASVGAGTVYVAAGAGYGLARAVALSPSAGRGLDGETIEGFSPRGVLFVADASEIGDSRELAEVTKEPKDVLQAESDGHGIALLPDEGVRAAIFDWLAPLKAR